MVAYLREDAASIEQRRVRIRRGDFKFLRIRWEGLPENWRLSQVMGVYADGAGDAVRNFVTLESTGVDSSVMKLFVIDLGNTGTVARIISFLGVGALLLVVGYYAPAPPREAIEVDDET